MKFATSRPSRMSNTTRFHESRTAEQVRRVYADIDQKRRATAYLHAPPLLMADVK